MKVMAKSNTTQINSTRLDTYENSWYNHGASFPKRILWYYVNAIFFETGLFPVFSLKNSLLKIFGAKLGKGVGIKPRVSIKSPWFLEIGDHVWIGENVWIDNLCRIKIDDHVCISQGAMLLTGNHDYKKSAFDLIVGEITLEKGVWIGAKAVVCPGVTCYSHSVLSVGSVAVQHLEAFTIYQGNPAQAKKKRQIS